MTLAHVEVVKSTNSVMELKALFNLVIGFLFILPLNGQLSLKEEPAIMRIMAQYEKSNQETPTIRAWRIQIMTTNDRSAMESGLLKFEMLYPHLEYKWEHNPPYYQVRVGAYEKRDDLEAFLLELKKEFPSSLPVKDDINKKEILKF